MNSTHVQTAARPSAGSFTLAAAFIAVAADAYALLTTAPRESAWPFDYAVCGACLLGMLSVASASSMAGRDLDPRASFILGALGGILFFSAALGCALINPGHIGWLLPPSGDWAQHYSGWEMFRRSPWTLPPGATTTLLYPVGSSVAYTDSLPLFALALKPFSPWLPDHFQYIGAWIVCSFALQGGTGALLLRRRYSGSAAILAGSFLFVQAPILLTRIHHDTLTAQWLILAGLWLYGRRIAGSQSTAREAAPWWLLGVIATLVHPYLALMFAAICAAYWARRVFVERERKLSEAAIAVGIHATLMFACWWAIGAMLVPMRDINGGTPFGHYSFNLLGFINPLGRSRLLPSFPLATSGQYEGYAYLGAGVLLLIVCLLVIPASWPALLTSIRKHWPLLAATIILALLAVSSTIGIGPWLLTDVEIHTPLFAAFRGSGRFIWLAYYLIVIVAIWRLRTYLPEQLVGLALIAVVALQMWDLYPAQAAVTGLRAGANIIPNGAVLSDDAWATEARGKSHLVLAPPPFCAHEAGQYLPFALFAADHQMTLNTGYVARWDTKATQAACIALHDGLAGGNFDKNSLYVVGADWRELFDEHPDQTRCVQLDGFTVCSAMTSLSN